jgi:hypothetical protein
VGAEREPMQAKDNRPVGQGIGRERTQGIVVL